MREKGWDMHPKWYGMGMPKEKKKREEERVWEILLVWRGAGLDDLRILGEVPFIGIKIESYSII